MLGWCVPLTDVYFATNVTMFATTIQPTWFGLVLVLLPEYASPGACCRRLLGGRPTAWHLMQPYPLSSVIFSRSVFSRTLRGIGRRPFQVCCGLLVCVTALGFKTPDRRIPQSPSHLCCRSSCSSTPKVRTQGLGTLSCVEPVMRWRTNDQRQSAQPQPDLSPTSANLYRKYVKSHHQAM